MMHAACLCAVKRGGRNGALILIKTANMATICMEEVHSPGELEATARGSCGFGSTGIAKLKCHHGGGGGGVAKKAKRQPSTESDEQTESDEEEEEEEDDSVSVCDTGLDD